MRLQSIWSSKSSFYQHFTVGLTCKHYICSLHNIFSSKILFPVFSLTQYLTCLVEKYCVGCVNDFKYSVVYRWNKKKCSPLGDSLTSAFCRWLVVICELRSTNRASANVAALPLLRSKPSLFKITYHSCGMRTLPHWWSLALKFSSWSNSINHLCVSICSLHV